MVRRVLSPRRGRLLASALALLTGACDASPAEQTRPAPGDAVAAFVEAWNARDYDEMHDFFDDVSVSRWSDTRLENFIEGQLEAGLVEDFEVSADGDAPKNGDVVTFELDVTYDSRASEAPVELNGGELDLIYEESDEAWTIRWHPGLMWPGVAGGHGFAVATKFSKRAPILDRRGNKLAVGSASVRRYPFGALGGTTVGHLGTLRKKDIEAGDLREPGDIVGASGLELAYDERLAGRPATKLQVVGRRGKVRATIGRVDGQRGRPVRSTLDIRVQRAAQGAYGGTVGGAVVLEPSTGDILAAVASSPFDPNNYVGVAGIEPFNRALSGLYPPGSAMKVVTAAAALDAKVFKPTSLLTGPSEYKGVRNFESGAYGTLTFADALTNSVNTAFAQIAEKLRPRRLTRYADAFGFNREPAMDLDAARSSFPFPEDEGDLLWGSIGQAQVLASPLQMASIAATIANDGKRMEPRAALHEARAGERVVSKQIARTMTGLMEGVVQGGTGVGAQISGVRVAGKTGTAEVDVGGQRLNHAWFISFAPAGDPKVAVAVVSEYGGIGGRVAAPIARSILASVLPFV